MGRIVAKALACGAAGFVAWILTAGLFPGNIEDPRWGAIEGLFVLLTVFLVSLTAGLFQGFQQGGKTNIILGTVIAVFFGTVAGSLGRTIGGGIAYGLFGPNVFNDPGLSPVTMMARTISCLFWGLGLGAGVGAGLRSVRGGLSGAVGGAVGGGIAGVLFDPVGWALAPTILPLQQGNEVGTISRGILVVLLGFTVGLFTALFERWSRTAWVRLVLGRNEGKEWPIDGAQTTIGRDERANIPLFADPQLPSLAAVIQRQGSQYLLVDPGSPIGVGLNGMRVPNAVLNPGDMIQVGSLQLQFLMKAGSAQRMMEARSKGIPVGGSSQPVQPIQPIQPVQPVQPQPGYQPGYQPTGAQTIAVPQPASQQTVMTPMAAAAPSGAAVRSLVVMGGPMAGQRIAISGPMEAGREGAGLRLAHDSQASRRHALITPGPAGLSVQDLGSTNGTFVNGVKTASASVKPGDIIRIGSTDLKVE